MNKNVAIHSWDENATISRTMPVAALAGQFVRLDDGDADVFALADGTGGGWMITQDFADVSLTAKILRDTFPEDVIRSVAEIGKAGSARKVRLGEWEGTDYLLDTGLAGDGLLDENSAIDLPLSFVAGKWAEAQTGEQVTGYLRGQLTPLNAGNTCRLLIDVVG